MICIHKFCRVKVRWKRGESFESENELLDNPSRDRGEHLILIRKNPTMYETFVKKMVRKSVRSSYFRDTRVR